MQCRPEPARSDDIGALARPSFKKMMAVEADQRREVRRAIRFRVIGRSSSSSGWDVVTLVVIVVFLHHVKFYSR